MEEILSNEHKEVQDIIAKLKFISKWNESSHKKLSVVSMALVEDTLMNRLWRTLAGGADSREKSYKFIQTETERGLTLTRKYLMSNDPFMIKIADMVIKALREAMPGIKNSHSPYPEDQMYISKVESFCDMLEVKISDVERLLVQRRPPPIPGPPTVPQPTSTLSPPATVVINGDQPPG